MSLCFSQRERKVYRKMWLKCHIFNKTTMEIGVQMYLRMTILQQNQPVSYGFCVLAILTISASAQRKCVVLLRTTEF